MISRFLSALILGSLLALASCSPQTSISTVKPVPSLPPTATPVELSIDTPAPSSTQPEANPNAEPTAMPEPLPTPVTVNIPNPDTFTWHLLVNGVKAPTDIQSARDGSGRLFIVEQPGRIRILKDGQMLETAFLDIRDRVGSNGSEQGLLGLAFHPRFAQNGYFFVNYTDLNGSTHIARFNASGASADPASEITLLVVRQPFANHNGGALAFGPDGTLMIGLGDGGSGGDPYGNAQSGNSLLGKLLRLDVDQGEPYAIPADNPYATSGEVNKEIWASGLRNPWRFSFDRLTGDLWIADVGQNQWEEINFVPAGTPGGLNFGWNKMEASQPFKGINLPDFTPPVAEYAHGPECSVSGGYVYRGQMLPEWQGVYFFGDFCSGAVWGLPTPPQGASAVLLFQTGFRISTFGSDETGELYVADHAGSIYQLERIP